MHGRKALGKEGRGKRQDAVIWLVPGYKVLLCARSFAGRGKRRGSAQELSRVRREGIRFVHGIRVELAKAHERMHFMQIATDLVLHLTHLRNIGVDFNLEQITIALQAIENAEEQVPACGAAMRRNDFGAIEEGL